MRNIDDRLYLAQNPLTQEEIREIMQKRLERSSAFVQNSQVETSSHQAYMQEENYTEEPPRYNPSNDFVSRTELKYLFDQMIREKTPVNAKTDVIEVKAFRPVGELSKTFKLSKKKSGSKGHKHPVVYTHLQVKQNSSTQEIVVEIRDIVAKK